MKKSYKIMSVLTIVLMIVCMCTSVFASNYIEVDDVVKAGEIDESAKTAMSKFGGTIIQYVTNAAIVIAVVMITILGIKYMLGSSEEKSEYKKSMMPLLVGAILVFGAATIAKVVIGLVSSFS